MGKDSNAAKLMEVGKEGYSGLVVCTPVRSSMSSSFFAAEALGLFEFSAKQSRKKNSGVVPTRADLAANKLVIGKSGQGMSFPYKSAGTRATAAPAIGLLAGLMRRL